MTLSYSKTAAGDRNMKISEKVGALGFESPLLLHSSRRSQLLIVRLT
ncbi:MAG: hypothetical protein PUP93_32750 [Rhizonema sp. NSF051]|nr:hypothetical protein [Rhizonema sp. NSF051]